MRLIQGVATARTGLPVSHPHPNRPAEGAALDFRQLRHLTKNSLQKILCHIEDHSDPDNAPTRQLCDEIGRRIRLSAAISDSLFGLTQSLAPFADRLRALAECVVALMADQEQMISLDITVDGTCPAFLQETVLRVAHELLGNAVKHGFYKRLLGQIKITATFSDHQNRLAITDDGWGFATQPDPGDGIEIAEQLAKSRAGRITLERTGQLTLATLDLPHAIA